MVVDVCRGPRAAASRSAARYARDMRTVPALVRACHPGPTAAVTTLATLLAVGAGLSPWRAALVGAAVFAGQLSIGWSNDAIDAERDRHAGRADKPAATGALSRSTLRWAIVAACAACLALSAALGPIAGGLHVALVAAGWAYDLGLKGTVWSWAPYAIAFGALPAVAWLALDPPALPPWWVLAVAATLGVAAHLLNVLPDFADDEATGVRGLPHRIGARATALLAIALLVAGTAVVVFAPEGDVPWWAYAVLAASLGLSIVALAARGSWPFRAAMVIALIDVTALVART